MLIEEAERPTKKAKTSVNLKRPLVDANIVVPAKSRKIVAE